MNGLQSALAGASAVAAAAVVVCTQPPLGAAAVIVALLAACICAITDLRTGLIFDAVSIPATALVLALAAPAGNAAGAISGLGTGAGALLVIYIITRGRGLGLGDVKMAAFIGCALGGAGVLRVLGLAFIGGGIYAAFLLITRRAEGSDAVPFAPYIYAALLFVSAFPGAPWPI